MSVNQKMSAGGASTRSSTAPLEVLRRATRQAENKRDSVQRELDRVKREHEEVSARLARRRAVQRRGKLLPYVASLLIISFSLIFLLPRVLGGGFYTATGVARIFTLFVAVACAVGLLCTVLLRRFRRIGLSVLRRALFVADVVTAWTLRGALGNDDYLAVMILLGLAMLFCEIVCVRRFVQKRTVGSSHRMLAVAMAILLAVSALLPVLPIGGAEENLFVSGGLTERAVRYDRGADGYAALTRVMLNTNDLLGIDRGEVLTVSGSVTIGSAMAPVTTLGEDALSGLSSVRAVYLPVELVRIEANALRDSGVTQLHISAPVLNLLLADGFSASSLEEIFLDAAAAVRIEGTILRDGITLRVPAHLLEEYQILYPQWAERIAAI